MLYFLKKNRIIKQKYNIQTRLYLNSPIKKQKIKKSEEKNLKNYLLLYPIANNANITTITKTIQIR
jgi:hypothetical protein